MSELDNIIKKLNSQFGKNTVISGDDMVSLVVERVSTGSLTLDIETGGGLPYGRLVELFGRESTEGSFDPTWAGLVGVDTKALKLSRPNTGELACDILEAVISSGDCGVVVLDSTAALVPAADLEKANEDVEQMGTRAKMVNRLIRRMHSA